MPMNISVGLSKKLGLPHFSSVGATCNITFEADHNLLDRDREGFQQRVEQDFAACRQTVTCQLARETGAPDSSSADAVVSDFDKPANGVNDDGVSQKQLDYAQQLAKRIPGLGMRRRDITPTRDAASSLPIAGMAIPCRDAPAAANLAAAGRDIRSGAVFGSAPFFYVLVRCLAERAVRCCLSFDCCLLQVCRFLAEPSRSFKWSGQGDRAAEECVSVPAVATSSPGVNRCLHGEDCSHANSVFASGPGIAATSWFAASWLHSLASGGGWVRSGDRRIEQF